MPQLFDLAAGILLVVALASAIYGLFAVRASARLMALRKGRNGVESADQFLPAVTILKPLHGDEPGLFDNLASFVQQDYSGPVRLIFGVSSENDPAIAVVHALQAAFPERDLELVVDPAQHGRNRKVSNLINMDRAATGDIVVLADSDIRVDSTYLSALLRALGRPGTGAVSCLYRGRSPGNFWSSLSMLGIDAHFLPNAAFAIANHLATPCFGSTIALRRDTLQRIGGFEALSDHLADDYVLGAKVRALGLEVTFPPFIVDHLCSEASPAELWAHDLRWARTIRAVDPAGYAGSIFTNPVPIALLCVGLIGFALPAIAVLVSVILLRYWTLHRLSRIFALHPVPAWHLMIRDHLSFVVYLWSFTGRRVEWRGERLAVAVDGRLGNPAKRAPRMP